MKLTSTRDSSLIATFQEALFSGLAPDGGLFQPIQFPNLCDIIERYTENTRFQTIATEISGELLKEEFKNAEIVDLCREAFPFSPRICRLEKNISILELFHGPSYAFKDFGASFLSTFMNYLLVKQGKKAIILTATSGDTGSAVAQAFKGKRSIDAIILYPSGRVSPLQELQLTTTGGNVLALEVKGSFDDCQRMVKEAFLDSQLSSELMLTSANSINVGRLLPQAFYFLYGWANVRKLQGANAKIHNQKDNASADSGIYVTVPSGNFGNLTSGVYAWRWGMNVDGFVAATNKNDVVPDYLSSSIYKPRASVQTLSNAMDVGNPSNFERLKLLFNDDWEAMTRWVYGSVVEDKETADEIRAVWETRGHILDPHTAVGYLASERFLHTHKQAGHMLTIGTAHPAKFSEVIKSATGTSPDLPQGLAEIAKKRKQALLIRNTVDDLKELLLDQYR